ncbi:hypothetical protein [Stackebrandtia nassauensis]|uniref:ESAT-6 protein secretion system EspG family protein n=1 Tax=Stackebrandtia nassauensis (strain DSM 44728 / CIP 108903 / NRRL B-16338 / NBRC 102104 / LLR-40K-21) TaxID=446470 RepID=D3PV77_STANL|nr:hypothetical protein [Stackebrandtia nassauensis]ADD41130.1 hypothetical protein Snas_1424 [Stackebrandtia nassauensis DSM 44728]
MTMRFDTETGVLRLDQASFDSLVTWYGDGMPDGPDLAELHEAGASTAGHPHPDVANGLEAVTGYRSRLRLDCVDHTGEELTGDGWAGLADAALLLDSEEGLRDFLALRPELIPVMVARIVHLGPRPRVDAEAVRLPRDVFEGLLGATEPERAAAAERCGGEPTNVIGALVDGPWLYWTVTSSWYTPEGEPASRAVRVVDTVAGLWSIHMDGMSVSMTPTNATAIWRGLSGLIPAETEEPEAA